MHAVIAFNHWCDRRISQFITALMVLLVMDVTWQVITRFILPQPSSFTEEVARFLLIWISLLGAATAYRHHLHLGFDLLEKFLSHTGKARLRQLNSAIVLALAVAVLMIGGGHLVYLTWTMAQTSSVLEVPMALVYAVIPFTGMLFVSYAIEHAFTLPVLLNEDASL